MIWTRKRLSLLLLLLVFLPLSALFSQEEDQGFWQEQRDYFQQYPVWEVETPTIIEWLNQLEQSEKELEKSNESLNRALSISDELKPELDSLSNDLERAHAQLLVTTGVTTILTVTVLVLLLSR